MTWAWAQNHWTNNPTWTVYSKNQLVMYHAICSTVIAKIESNSAFDLIIPSGTAIQNYRTQQNDDNLNHDGTHLSNLGCYIAAAMWVKTITGYDIANLTTGYVANKTWGSSPSVTITPAILGNIVQAVNDATATPFAVTPL